MRGQSDAVNFELAIAHLHGRVEQQIQQLAAEVGISANRIASGLAALLSPSWQGVFNNLPAVRGEAPGARRGMEPLALAVHAHSGEAQPSAKAQPATREIPAYWAAMTPEQRSAEVKRRAQLGRKNKLKKDMAANKAAGAGQPALKKARFSPEGLKAISEATKKRWAKIREQAKKQAKKPAKQAKNHGIKNLDKQKVYQARYEARKAGQQLPPLPPKPAPNGAAVQ